MRATLLFLAAVILLADARAEPYAPILPGTELDDAHGRLTTEVSVRILGDRGGRLVPVAGAVVSGWSEETGPGATGAHKIAEGVTDEHGFANVFWPEDEYAPFHWIVEADGWASWHDAGLGGSGDLVLCLARTHRFRLLDPFGRPLAGARVEAFHGCPHAPALRTIVSGEEGLVVLPGLAENPALEIWVVAPGVDPGPYDIPDPLVGEETPVLLTDPGRTATGIVVGPDGKPRAGMVVREIGYPRGPATTTDATGRFVLHGIENGALGVFRTEALYDERPAAAVEDFEETIPLRLVADPTRPRAPGEGEPRHTVDVLVLQGKAPRRGVPVSLTRLEDGLTVRGTTGRLTEGLVSLQVPPGDYRAVAGGGLSHVVRGEATVRVPRTDATPVTFALDRQPVLSVRGDVPRVSIVLRVPGAERALERIQFPPLPAEGPAILVFGGFPPFFVPAGPFENGFRRVEIAPALVWREPTEVRVRVRSEDPDVDADDIALEWSEGEWEIEPRLTDDGVWIARTPRVGRAVLAAELDGHQSEWRVLDLPAKPARIELPDIVLRRTAMRTFQVIDAEGKPVPEVDPERGPRGGCGNELLDSDGRFTVEVGPRPEPWVITTPRYVTPPPTEHWYPLRIDLSLSSPPEIRFPGGRITVEVSDEEGRPVPAVGYVDLERLEGEGTLDLRGVPAGPHVLIVGAPDRVGEVRRIVLRKGEHRRIEVRLRPRE